MGEIRPILFNSDMVRAILNGRKTVTRRVIRFINGNNPNWTGYVKDGLTLYNGKNVPCNKRPPCKSGDVLYVRETWNTKCRHCESECPSSCSAPYYVYKADHPYTEDKWRPSIHMPKKAVRIWLKVTDVKVERLQDIDDDGIVSEGLEIGCDFENIWNATVKKPDLPRYGWDANPWVWVIEFERCKKPKTGGKYSG